ncbi:hypothetical protein TNCV_3519381 [Trichonephila clavipes]|uniref:Uncharacterized protein n=1 Tax=Trichonephila clavipes TaxID=2585209 RepID=A0A8X6T357_TRICX|nr:hypothetical protein TNCV_3519381 [Trichonephila clavipes]
MLLADSIRRDKLLAGESPPPSTTDELRFESFFFSTDGLFGGRPRSGPFSLTPEAPGLVENGFQKPRRVRYK